MTTSRRATPKAVNFSRYKSIEEGAEAKLPGVASCKVWGSWTWLQFPKKPAEGVVKALPGLLGKHWRFTGGKYQAWLCKEVLDPAEVIAQVKGLVGAGNSTALAPAAPATPAPAPTPQRTPAPIIPLDGEARAQQLYKLAEGMQASIQQKFNPAISQQRMTRRRAGIAESMAADGRRLEKIQSGLVALADGHISGALPKLLQGINNKTQVEALLYSWVLGKSDTERLASLGKAGIRSWQEAEAKALLEGLLKPASQESETAQKIRQLERDLIGAEIPGYFPTPKALAEQLVERAGLRGTEKVLEPSAGKGNIAEAIRARYPDIRLYCLEYQQQLRTLLQLKGFQVFAEHDFLAHPAHEEWDAILMNPPFERWQGHWQDIQHVQHAYAHLRPGGRLVAIMSAGPFHRQDQESSAFRVWLQDVGGFSRALPDGSFDRSERPTGVATYLVEINKAKVSVDELVRRDEAEHPWWEVE